MERGGLGARFLRGPAAEAFDTRGRLGLQPLHRTVLDLRRR